MRLIHTSDWQIGKAIRLADEATREVLRDERLGSGLVDHSQKMTVAARATAEKKTVGQRS